MHVVVRYNMMYQVGWRIKLSPGGLRQFTLSPIRDYDRTQELGLSLLGRVPMLALYPHTSLVQ